jgi:hypothetical protein
MTDSIFMFTYSTSPITMNYSPLAYSYTEYQASYGAITNGYTAGSTTIKYGGSKFTLTVSFA